MAGKFLVATKYLSDPVFGHSVILMLENDCGIIVNGPKMGVLNSENNNIPVYFGGPCNLDGSGLILMHGHKKYGDKKKEIMPEVYYGGPEIFDSIFELPLDDRKFCMYSGHAGWRPGQLKREMEKYWTIADCSHDLLFHTNREDLWDLLKKDKNNVPNFSIN